VALSLSFFPFVFLFFLILAPRSDGSEPPPPPLSSTTFCFTSQSSDPVLYGGDLLESLGGSSLQRIPSLLSARIGLSSGRWDLLRRWMFGGHRVWGFLPTRVSINYPILGVDHLKLFFFKSPYHTRIEWQIRFDLSVVCLAGIKDLNLLLFWTLVAVVALVIFWILVKLCAFWCYCCCCDIVVGVVVVDVVVIAVFFLFLYCFAALYVGSFVVTNVTFSTLYIGFCIPLCRIV
jgi:hypothetical protein